MGTWFQFSEYLWILCSVAAGRGGVSWGNMGDTGLTVGSEGLASQTLNLSVLRSPGRPQTLPPPAEVIIRSRHLRAEHEPWRRASPQEGSAHWDPT